MNDKPKLNYWIIGINLLILFAYSTLIKLGGKSPDGGLAILIGTASFIAIQIVICLGASIFVYTKEFLLSALIVLLVGFSTCVFVNFR